MGPGWCARLWCDRWTIATGDDVWELGDGQPMPDQLITFVPARGDGVLRRVATDVSITEVVTRANDDAGRQVATCLEERAKLKDDTHRQAAQAAGCEFVPLVFTSLGRMHQRTEKWLKLDDMALDERLLQRIGSDGGSL
jgi:hypothetical protein